MTISFRNHPQLINDGMGLMFFADVDGQRVKCLISLEALDSLSKTSVSEDAEVTFRLNKTKIEAIAEAMIRSGRLDPFGEVLIQEVDIV